MSSGTATYQIKLMVVHHQTRPSATSTLWHQRTCHPNVLGRIVNVGIVRGGFLGIIVVGKRPCHPNQSLVIDGLKVVEFGRHGGTGIPRVGDIIVTLESSGVFATSKQIESIAGLKEGTFVPRHVVFAFVQADPDIGSGGGRDQRE